MCVKRLWFYFLFWCVLAVAAHSQEDPLTQLSSNIKSELLNLRQQTTTLQTDLASTISQLQQASQDLKLSESERKALEIQSTNLSASLTSINTKLNDSYDRINTLQAQVKARNKALLIAGIVGFIILILKVLGGILYFKNIKVPRIVDWLL